MIRVTRLDHSSLVLNSDLIEHIAANPDTVIALTNGQNFTVLEAIDEVVESIRSFRRSLMLPLAEVRNGD
jgi:flagellar protein FlbD